jgi:type II secretory pathway component GspD/PulD (secretin)
MIGFGRIRSLTFVVFCAAGLLVSEARAQDPAVVNNVFFQSDLRQAIEDVAAQAGVNIIADPSVQGVVSVTLEDVTVRRALDLLLAGTEYRVEATEDYYLVYSPDVRSELFTDISETRIYELTYVAPEAARSLLPEPLQRYVRFEAGTARLAITAPSEIMERIVADLALIDRSNGETVFYAPHNISAERARDLLPVNLQSFVRVDPERNTLAVTAPRAASDIILEQVRRLDTALPPNSVDVPTVSPSQIVRLNHARATSVVNLLPLAVADFVRADEATNTVAVSAPPRLAEAILRDISVIDAPRPHIMLDARVVVLEQSDILDFGGSVQWPQIGAGGVFADNVDFPWEVRIGYTPSREFTNALTMTLNLLSRNDEATIITSPQVLAQDGVPAEIRVTTEEYFQIASENGAFIRSTLEQIETGTILAITPRVGRNGDITLDLQLEVSDVVSRGQMGLPVVSRRTAISTIQVENGGTAAVAGLVDTRSQLGEAGTPGLRSVPLLGRAFRTDSLTHNARQVAIFVTATIVDQHGERFQTGESGRRSYPLVSEEVYRAELARALDTLGLR